MHRQHTSKVGTTGEWGPYGPVTILRYHGIVTMDPKSNSNAECTQQRYSPSLGVGCDFWWCCNTALLVCMGLYPVMVVSIGVEEGQGVNGGEGGCQ